MAMIIMLWDCENKANVIEFGMERVSEAMNKMLMIAFGMYCKELWGPHWMSLLMSEQRCVARQEKKKDQKFIGGCSKSSALCWHVLCLSSLLMKRFRCLSPRLL